MPRLSKIRKISKKVSFIKTKQASVFVSLIIFAVIGLIGIQLLSNSQAAIVNVSVPASTGAGVLVPTSGVYWGGTNNGDTKTAPGCENKIGFPLLECKVGWAGSVQNLGTDISYQSNMEHFFTQCDRAIPQALKDSAKKSGRKVLMVNMKCGNWTDMSAANATLVSSITARTNELAALNVPIILSYHHEPENDSCDAATDKGGYQGTPDEYRAASRQFIKAMRSEANRLGTNKIATGWILMGFTFDKAGTETFNGSCDGVTRSGNVIRNPDNWYPGDDAVDWILSDKYDNDGKQMFDRMVSSLNNWSNSCAVNKPTTNYNCSSAKFSKPIGFAETSVQGTPEYRAAFFDDMAKTLPNYPKFRAYAFWSAAGNVDAGFDGRLDRADDPGQIVLKSFARLELSSYVQNLQYNGEAPQDPGDTIKPDVRFATSVPATATGSVIISATATDNVAVGRVELLINDAVVGSVSTDPYTFTWDTTKTPNGSATSQLRAYDLSGNIGLSVKSNSIVNNQINSGGDLNNDGRVDVFDLSILLSNYNTSYARADLNNDGRVDVFDLSILLSKWGS